MSDESTYEGSCFCGAVKFTVSGEPAGMGYYIVKGSGLPRIDIVGSSRRINWNQLLSSISIAEFGGATVNP